MFVRLCFIFFHVFKKGNSCWCFLYGYALRGVRLPACTRCSTCQRALAVWGQSWWSGLPERQAVALEDWHCVTPLSVSLISHPFDAAAYIKAVMFEKGKKKRKTHLPWIGLIEKNTESQDVWAPFSLKRLLCSTSCTVLFGFTADENVQPNWCTLQMSFPLLSIIFNRCIIGICGIEMSFNLAAFMHYQISKRSWTIKEISVL